jgi:hypothetical protein
VAELTSVDLVICGGVAVNRQGARVGKGGGFSDLEFALLVEAGLIVAGEEVITCRHGGAERFSRDVPVRHGPARAWTTRGWLEAAEEPSDHPARSTIGLVNRPICPGLGS